MSWFILIDGSQSDVNTKCKAEQHLKCGPTVCLSLGTWQIGDEQKNQEETFQTVKSKFPQVF